MNARFAMGLVQYACIALVMIGAVGLRLSTKP
jgi:hypothetical protein